MDGRRKKGGKEREGKEVKYREKGEKEGRKEGGEDEESEPLLHFLFHTISI